MNERIVGTLLVVAMCMVSIAPVIAQETPFVINGYVSYANGEPVSNPSVTVTNLSTGFNVSTYENYYRVLTDSGHVGDTITINATDGTIFNKTVHDVTEADIEDGGLFMQNRTLVFEMPDLAITAMSDEWVDEENAKKYKYCINYTVKNIGDATAGVSITSIKISGIEVATDTVPELAPGENCTKTVGPFVCLCSQTVNITVCANHDGAVDEFTDTNNCLEKEKKFGPCMPDLVILDNHSVMWVDRMNWTFNVTYTVKNVGNWSASSSTTNISVVNYDNPVPALSSGESYTSTVGPFIGSFNIDTHKCEILINISADWYGTVEESDEDNNCCSDAIGIPYLEFHRLSTQRKDELSKVYLINFQLYNSGGAASTNVTRVLVYIDGNPNASATKDDIPVIDKDAPSSGMVISPFTMTGTGDTIRVCVEWEDGINCAELELGNPAPLVFDTGTGTYPSISGTHEGTIIPDEDIEVNRLYTYACAGTGGHTEYVRIWNESEEKNVTGNWSGYQGNYQNVTISPAITLLGGHEYNYTIRTGSYPQIIHASQEHKAKEGGDITCTKFTGANGKEYDNWIPAIRLWREE